MEQHIIDLLTPVGFENQFYQFCSEYSCAEEAYEATERMHEQAFGIKKYSGYHSFKNAKNERIRKQRKK